MALKVIVYFVTAPNVEPFQLSSLVAERVVL